MKKAALSTHERIRLEAYLLSEQAGHPTGMEKTFWKQAEAIVRGRTAVVAGAGKAKAKVAVKAKPKSSKKAAPPKKELPAKDAAPVKAKAKAAKKRTR